MRYLIITDCRDCSEWTPGDSYGIGTRCGDTPPVYREVDEVRQPNGDYVAPIPDHCPRLKARE